MTNINLEAYYSAGYFLIRENNSKFWLNNPIKLVPQRMISLESEFCPQFNWSWGSDLDRKDTALKFGIDEEKWDEFKQWCRDHHHKDIDIWTMFYSPDAARSFVHEFIPETRWDDLTLIGAGLHQSCIAEWMKPLEPLTEGVEARLQQHLLMETGGQFLGFDIASFAHHNFDHTWLSHGHHRGIFKEHGIRPDTYGLLQSLDDAIIARDYTNTHDGYYYDYWLLMSYPLKYNKSPQSK